jgi:hypothetical protein
MDLAVKGMRCMAFPFGVWVGQLITMEIGFAILAVFIEIQKMKKLLGDSVKGISWMARSNNVSM